MSTFPILIFLTNLFSFLWFFRVMNDNVLQKIFSFHWFQLFFFHKYVYFYLEQSKYDINNNLEQTLNNILCSFVTVDCKFNWYMHFEEEKSCYMKLGFRQHFCLQVQQILCCFLTKWIIVYWLTIILSIHITIGGFC